MNAGADSFSLTRFLSSLRQQRIAVEMSDLIRNPTVEEVISLCQSNTVSSSAIKGLLDEERERTTPPEPFSLITSHTIDAVKQQASKQTGLQPDDIEDAFPLTPFQYARLEPCIEGKLSELPVEFITVGFDLKEGVDLERLKEAFEQAIKVEPVSCNVESWQ